MKRSQDYKHRRQGNSRSHPELAQDKHKLCANHHTSQRTSWRKYENFNAQHQNWVPVFRHSARINIKGPKNTSKKHSYVVPKRSSTSPRLRVPIRPCTRL